TPRARRTPTTRTAPRSSRVTASPSSRRATGVRSNPTGIPAATRRTPAAGGPGFGGAGLRMPGVLQAARVVLFVVAGLQLLLAAVLVIGVSIAAGRSGDARLLVPVLVALAIVACLLASAGIVLGVRLSRGAGAVR